MIPTNLYLKTECSLPIQSIKQGLTNYWLITNNWFVITIAAVFYFEKATSNGLFHSLTCGVSKTRGKRSTNDRLRRNVFGKFANSWPLFLQHWRCYYGLPRREDIKHAFLIKFSSRCFSFKVIITNSSALVVLSFFLFWLKNVPSFMLTWNQFPSTLILEKNSFIWCIRHFDWIE